MAAPRSATSSSAGGSQPSSLAVLEAILFVGDDQEPLTAARIGETMELSAEDVFALAEQLDQQLAEQDSAIRVSRDGNRLGLTLAEDMERVRERFYGRARQTQLTSAALEVLSLVAYQQPINAAAVDEKRGAKSGPLLAQLVRRRLLSLHRSADPQAEPLYRTTDRFLRVFGLNSLEDLPPHDAPLS